MVHSKGAEGQGDIIYLFIYLFIFFLQERNKFIHGRFGQLSLSHPYSAALMRPTTACPNTLEKDGKTCGGKARSRRGFIPIRLTTAFGSEQMLFMP